MSVPWPAAIPWPAGMEPLKQAGHGWERSRVCPTAATVRGTSLDHPSKLKQRPAATSSHTGRNMTVPSVVPSPVACSGAMLISVGGAVYDAGPLERQSFTSWLIWWTSDANAEHSLKGQLGVIRGNSLLGRNVRCSLLEWTFGLLPRRAKTRASQLNDRSRTVLSKLLCGTPS